MRAPLALTLLFASACGVPDELSVATFELLAHVAPNELTVVDGVPIVTPDRDQGLFAEVLSEDGATLTIELRSGLDGRVYRALAPLAAIESTSSALHGTPPGACQDRARSLLEHRWNTTLEWRFNADSTPAGLDRDRVEAHVRRGTTNITSSRNDCGLADEVGATHRYLGRTARRTNIGADGSCSGNDGANVVDFGALPSGTLGVACTWYRLSDRAAVESDLRLHAGARWYTEKPEGCTGRFGIQAVMTHERGHTFGLGHVSEHEHPHLTMSTRIRACSNGEVTLGRGDVIGLRAKY